MNRTSPLAGRGKLHCGTPVPGAPRRLPLPVDTLNYRRSTISSGRDDGVIEALNEIVTAHPRWGFWKCYDRTRLDGKTWNHKRLWRVYREMRLNLPRRTKKHVPRRERQALEVPEALNAIWAVDVLDEGVREALDIVIDTSIPGGRLVRTLEQIGRWRGLPDAIRCDNGPEILSQAFVDLCQEHQVEIRYIQPGKPNQNAYIERFNRTYREEVLNAHLFSSLSQVREVTYRWLQTYNEFRPHDALGRVPPAVFRRRLEEPGLSTFELST